MAGRLSEKKSSICRASRSVLIPLNGGASFRGEGVSLMEDLAVLIPLNGGASFRDSTAYTAWLQAVLIPLNGGASFRV